MADGMCISCQGRGSYYDINLEKLIPDKTTTLFEVYESLKVTAGFLRILKKKYGVYFATPFCKLPEDISNEVIYGTYDNGKQSYCLERILRNSCEKGEDVEEVYAKTLCPDCLGKRFHEESLSVDYKGKNIADVLEMSVTEAISFFADQNSIVRPLRILDQMGMGYLTLGQPSSSLSGGEAQRVKLAKELGRHRKGNILYVLDEPTTGLSLYDTALLLKLLDQLVVNGNSVIVIEHNVEVLKSCDYIIELGPEGGDKGGEIIAKGIPEQLKDNPNSRTGGYLV